MERLRICERLHDSQGWLLIPSFPNIAATPDDLTNERSEDDRRQGVPKSEGKTKRKERESTKDSMIIDGWDGKLPARNEASQGALLPH